MYINPLKVPLILYVQVVWKESKYKYFKTEGFLVENLSVLVAVRLFQ